MDAAQTDTVAGESFPPTVNAVWTVIVPLEVSPDATLEDIETAVIESGTGLHGPLNVSQGAVAYGFPEIISDVQTSTQDIAYVLASPKYTRDAAETLLRRRASHKTGVTHYEPVAP